MRDIVVHESGEQIDLQNPTPDHQALLLSIVSRNSRPKTRKGELRCAQHGGELYLQMRHGILVGCHWGRSDLPRHPVALMSTEHKIQVEYIARAAEREGLPVSTEKTLPTHVRPDLVVNSDTAFEVQRSGLAVAQAKARTTKAVRGGMRLSLWISDKPDDVKPAWLGQVPSVRVYAPDWKRLPSMGEAKVTTGLRSFFLVPHRRDTKCEHPRRCPGSHLRSAPVTQTLDRLSVGLAIGHYVPIQHGRLIWIATNSDVEEYGLKRWSVAPRVEPQTSETKTARRIACRASDAASTPLQAACCGDKPVGVAGGPLLPACTFCPNSPTYWRRND